MQRARLGLIGQRAEAARPACFLAAHHHNSVSARGTTARVLAWSCQLGSRWRGAPRSCTASAPSRQASRRTSRQGSADQLKHECLATFRRVESRTRHNRAVWRDLSERAAKHAVLAFLALANHRAIDRMNACSFSEISNIYVQSHCSQDSQACQDLFRSAMMFCCSR